MAVIIAELKIMPESPEVNLDAVYDAACVVIREFVDEKHKKGEIKKEIEPIGFGLSALKVMFAYDESLGSPDTVADKLTELDQVDRAETIGAGRALG